MAGLVVVGDCLLDIDLVGAANRLSPDAPVPVVDVADELVRPGGAGLAARLAHADGAAVQLLTALADDSDAARLRAALAPVPVLASASPAATPVKTRVRSGDRSITRFDRGGPAAADVPVTAAMLDALGAADAVLAADYGRGLLANPVLREALTALARHVPVVWDPHSRGPQPVPGCWLVVPNLAEARAAVGRDVGGANQLAEAARLAGELRRRWRSRAVAVTLGSAGALLDRGEVPVAVPAPSVTVTDPCGAGDRLAVTAATALWHGASVDEALDRAVSSAADFLARGGVSALGAQDAPAPSDSARTVVRRTRAAGGTVVATGGCFDLLHTGHLRTLRAARALGDCLIVCLNSDRSVRRLKGTERPINHEADRAELLASLECVDAVVLFDTDTPEPLLTELRPDIWVKGGDYSVDSLSEVDTVRSWGGRVVVVPYHGGRSTTRLANALADID